MFSAITRPLFAAPESAGPKSFGRLWSFLSVSFNGLIVAHLLQIASSVAAISFFRGLGDVSMPAAMQPAEAVVNFHQAGAMLITGVFTLAAIVAYCRFYYRAVANLHFAQAKGVVMSPSAAIGWHFAPVANLWKPFAVISQVWRASHDPSTGAGEIPRSLLLWWGSWVASLIFGAAAFFAAWNAGFYGYGITDRDAYSDSLTLHIIASVFAIATAGLVLEFSADVRLAQNSRVIPAGQRLTHAQ